jgi:hypothetical protein
MALRRTGLKLEGAELSDDVEVVPPAWEMRHKVPWLAQRRGGAELVRVAGTETDDAEVVPPAWD